MQSFIAPAHSQKIGLRQADKFVLGICERSYQQHQMWREPRDDNNVFSSLKACFVEQR
jgi:hypothetical protein